MESNGKTACRRQWLLGFFLICLAVIACSTGADAAPMEQLRDSVQEFTMDNGLRFLIVEKHDAPVFSYVTCVDAGGSCVVNNSTGIAHMLEHMVFKGTATVGTNNYRAEKKAMKRTDDIWSQVLAERNKGTFCDSTRLEALTTEFKELVDAEFEYAISNDFSKILDENGVRGVNAFTSAEHTCFFYQLPSNRLELWARLEGERLAKPVLREFYKEREVVANERRLTTDSSPTGRLYENFLGIAYKSHPYKASIIGHETDIANWHRSDIYDFLDKYFVPENMTICLVGDVTVEEVKKMAKKYFSKMRAGDDPADVVTREPWHKSERRVIAHEDANPVIFTGWQSPDALSPDFATMELMMEILGGGRSSRLYKRLVKDDQTAINAGAGVGIPGSKYLTQAMTFITCAADADPLVVEQAVYEEIERLITDGPTQAELDKVKAGYLANELRSMRSPSRLALALASADQLQKDWRYAFDHLAAIEAVTTDQIQAAAGEYLIQERRSVAMIQKKAADEGDN
jgi:predicted Zn-dependent peptidase